MRVLAACLVIFGASALSGCLAVAAGGAVVGIAVGVTGAVVGTGLKATGAVAGAGVHAVTGGGKDKKKHMKDKKDQKDAG